MPGSVMSKSQISPRAFSSLVTITGIGEKVHAVSWREAGKRVGYCPIEGFESSRACFAQQGLQFGEELFDRIEVGAVWRQIAQRRADSLDGFADTLDLVARQIVHHDNVAPP